MVKLYNYFFSKSFVRFFLLFQIKGREKKQHLMSTVFGDLNFFLPIFVKFALQFKKNPFLLGIKIPMRQFQTFFLRINALYVRLTS